MRAWVQGLGFGDSFSIPLGGWVLKMMLTPPLNMRHPPPHNIKYSQYIEGNHIVAVFSIKGVGGGG